MPKMEWSCSHRPITLDGCIPSSCPRSATSIVVPRLGTGLALLVPLQWAPLVMALVGLLVQALPVPILLSARCSNWAPLPTRLLLAAIYVALPSTREIHVVLTNAQWHMALVAALLAFAASPRTWRGRLAMEFSLLIAGLTGPYCIILAPMVLFYWWLRRQSWTLVIFALTSLAACLQIWMLLHSTQRAQGALGANAWVASAHAGREYRLLRHIWQLFIRQAGAHGLSSCPLPSSAFAFIFTVFASPICEWKLFPGLLRSLAGCFVAKPPDR